MSDDQDEHEASCEQMYYALVNFMDFALHSHDPSCVTLSAMQAIGCTLNQLDIESHREGLHIIREAADIIEQELRKRVGKEMLGAEETTTRH
jgi:hypothetical protein